jgi:dihydroorotase
VGDLFIRDGRIVDTFGTVERRSARVIDASGLIVSPGLVDIHVHFREPGQTHKETIESGSHCAAAGGFTSVVCMPNTSPPADNAGTIEFIKNKIDDGAVVRVYPTGAITVGLKGESLAPIGSLKRAGVVAITDDGHCVQNNALMRRAMEYARMFDLPIFDHCQDYSLTEGSVMHEGEMSLKLGLKGWPAAAEELIVARNAVLSEVTGQHIHCQHISSRRSVEIIRRAKARGLRLTAEVTPHHLDLTDACLARYDTVFKVNPPLRTEDDRQALLTAVADGLFDCIATDHAPHTPDEKDVELDHAPFGMLGLETALAVVLEVLVHSRRMPLPQVLALLTHKPAALVKLPAGALAHGAAADVTLIDLDEKWTCEPTRSFSRSRNTPWRGRSFRGRVRTTVVGGRIVYDSGKIVRDI